MNLDRTAPRCDAPAVSVHAVQPAACSALLVSALYDAAEEGKRGTRVRVNGCWCRARRESLAYFERDSQSQACKVRIGDGI